MLVGEGGKEGRGGEGRTDVAEADEEDGDGFGGVRVAHRECVVTVAGCKFRKKVVFRVGDCRGVGWDFLDCQAVMTKDRQVRCHLLRMLLSTLQYPCSVCILKCSQGLHAISF